MCAAPGPSLEGLAQLSSEVIFLPTNCPIACLLCREAERARVAELKEAARKQLAQLQGEASEAADEAKAAVATAK